MARIEAVTGLSSPNSGVDAYWRSDVSFCPAPKSLPIGPDSGFDHSVTRVPTVAERTNDGTDALKCGYTLRSYC